jgi:cobalamin 5'-phosphate synthase/cobalamin synthase
MRWFPLVGAGLGAVSALLWIATRAFLPPFAIAVLLLIAETLVTGALHVDALADTADGFGGGRTREDILRIMRDHAIGSYGGSAITLLLLWKAACLATVVSQPQPYRYLLVIPAVGRWTAVLISRILPYARRSQAGQAVSPQVTRRDLAVASAMCAGIVLPIASWRGLICWTVGALVTVLWAHWCRLRLGGITGDTIGANLQLAESVQLLVALLLR